MDKSFFFSISKECEGSVSDKEIEREREEIAVVTFFTVGSGV